MVAVLNLSQELNGSKALIRRITECPNYFFLFQDENVCLPLDSSAHRADILYILFLSVFLNYVSVCFARDKVLN